jgi:Rrf2 family iron-sulfur cluster assembly transcriptional regulator
VINLANTKHNRPVSIGSIATEEDVSSEFLEQIFFKLKKAGLIRSIRGPGGGFVLNRTPGEISVQDILVAVGETRGLTPCTLRRKTLCNRPEPCAAHDIWIGLQKTMEDYLTKVTLKDILAKNGKQMFATLEAGQDFSI